VIVCIDRIMAAACACANASVAEVTGRGRMPHVVAARAAVALIAHDEYGHSYPDIACVLRGRASAHATVQDGAAALRAAVAAGYGATAAMDTALDLLASTRQRIADDIAEQMAMLQREVAPPGPVVLVTPARDERPPPPPLNVLEPTDEIVRRRWPTLKPPKRTAAERVRAKQEASKTAWAAVKANRATPLDAAGRERVV
jgi:hypothetical protein